MSSSSLPITRHNKPLGGAQAISNLPRGVQPFQLHNRRIFRALLPGAVSRSGHPESMLRWRRFMNEASQDPTSWVGVLHGPFGSGKSSLVQAGIVPMCRHDVRPIVVDCAVHTTLEEITTKVRQRLGGGQGEVDLVGLLTTQRQTRPSIRVLLVLDHFEYFLERATTPERNGLCTALRQSNGTQLKSLLVVEDRSWTELCRIMNQLEIPMIHNSNAQFMDHFDQLHAKHVLTVFGKLLGRIHANSSVDEAPSDFVEHAIHRIAQGEMVRLIELQVFAQAFEQIPWVDAKQLDRIWLPEESLGVCFLKRTLATTHSEFEMQAFERTSQRVLTSMLPSGDDERVPRRSLTVVRESVPELTDAGFRRLLHLLEHELGLLIGSASGQEYRLAHPFLVEPLRRWQDDVPPRKSAVNLLRWLRRHDQRQG